MTITADGSGNLSGQFTIPANVRAGTKKVDFAGSEGSVGSAQYTGAATLTQEVVHRTLTVPQRTSIDPLAQTFSIPARAQIGGIDLWIEAKGTSPIEVQIRETEVGFPTSKVLARARLVPASITAGALNRFSFPWPVTLQANQEYALVVMCDDAVGSCGIAELGKVDLVSGAWVTSQPYSIGVLLSSSNASTWTPHQAADLTFKLLKCTFTSLSRTISLGQVAVVNATDLVVFAMTEMPDESTSIMFQLTLPDASVLTVAAMQPVKLTAGITGNVLISALLAGSADFSPILWPSTQLVHGVLATTGTYVTRAMLAGNPARVRVIYDGLLPAGSACLVEVKGIDGGDTYVTVPSIATQAMDNGFVEFTHELSSINEASVRVRLTLSGTAAARPYVRNFRMLVM